MSSAGVPKGRWGLKLLLGLFMVLLLGVMGYAVKRFTGVVAEEKEGEALYDALRKGDAEAGPQEAAEESAPPGQAEERVPVIDFPGLLAVNEDTVGWLLCEDTPIDYPIVQGEDNEYYLYRLFDGTQNKAGTLFLDYRNAPDFSDANSVVYGHHMKNGTMLASLVGYKRQAYYDLHPTMCLYTPQGDCLVELFSGYVTEDGSAFITQQFESDEAFLRFIAHVTARSAFTSDVRVDADDRILTLVTCTYEKNNARFVLHGKLSPLYPED